MCNILKLEDFVMELTPTNYMSMCIDLHADDYELALHTYAGDTEYPADMSNEHKLFYCLFILESEGR
jgi:hypothetical protein